LEVRDGVIIRSKSNEQIIRAFTRSIEDAGLNQTFTRWAINTLPLVLAKAGRDSTVELAKGIPFIFGARDATVLAAEKKIIFDLVKNLTAETQNGIITLFRDAVANNLSRAEFKAKMVSETGLTPIRGWTLKYRAEMITRTEMSRLYNTERMTRDAMYLGANHNRKWIAIIDPRTGEDSQVRNQRIMPLRDWLTHNFGDGEFGFPPLRPNDRCTTDPVIP
jgi:hypothetical protein